MKIVSDAGPLMALAKVDGLAVLFRLFPRILIPPAVYEETVVAGQRLGALDAALVKAHQADAAGNLRYRLTARNFNPLVETAGRLTLVEAEEIVDGYLDPNDIHTPGIYVQQIVKVEDTTKDIEQRTVRPRVD